MINTTNELEQVEMVEQESIENETQPEQKKMSAKKRIEHLIELEENIETAESPADKASARKALQTFKEELKVSVKKNIVVARKSLQHQPELMEFIDESSFSTHSEFVKFLIKYTKNQNNVERWNRENAKKEKRVKFTVEVSKIESEQFKEKLKEDKKNINQLLRSFVVSYSNGESISTAPIIQSDTSIDPFALNELKTENNRLKDELDKYNSKFSNYKKEAIRIGYDNLMQFIEFSCDSKIEEFDNKDKELKGGN